MTRDQELWGMALAVLRDHGEQAPHEVAERIGALALEGQPGGVAMWREVARRVDQLMHASGPEM